MKFVCRHDDYRHQINPGTVEYKQGQGNTVIPVQTSPLLTADFERGLLTAAEREACRQFFDGRSGGAYGGEQPGMQRHDGIFGNGIEGSINGDAEGAFYSGSRWEFMYSLFDTQNPTKCPPPYRECYEAVLSADAAACHRLSVKNGFLGENALHPSTDVLAGEIVCLDVLMFGRVAIETPEGIVVAPAQAGPRWEPNFPWPAYDEISGPPAARAKKIDETCELIGLDKTRVADYEIEHKAQATVVARLLGLSMAETKERIDAFLAAKSVAPVQKLAVPPKILDPDEMAPNQLENMPKEALSEGIRFSDFVRP